MYVLSFERELKNKLAQKASGQQSEETVLLKAFKYFDLNNNGTVEPEEFAKAIEKIGIMIPTRQVSFSSTIEVYLSNSSLLPAVSYGQQLLVIRKTGELTEKPREAGQRKA